MSLGESFRSVLDAARTGADWAVAALYGEFNSHLLAYLRSREPGEAEDLASETWIDLARGLPRFTGGEDDFRRYLFTIARRRLIDHRRRAAARPTEAVPDDVLVALVSGGDVEEEALAAMSAEGAAASIAALLPPAQADVVLLRVVGGFSADEVAAIMGIRAGTVRVLQHRALARLAAALSGEHVTESWPRAM